MGMPVRVLRIITRFNIGGPAIHAALLSNQLDPEQFSTWLVTGTPDATEGDLSDLLRRERMSVIQLKTFRQPLHPWLDLVTLARLVRIVWSTRPQIIHTHMAKAGALGRFAGFLYNRFGPGRRSELRAVLIHTFHGHVLDGYFSPRVSRFFITIERWLARRTDCLIAVSETIQRELLAYGIGRREQWRVVSLGLDLGSLTALPLPNGAATVRFGMVGRLVPIKNPSLFLQAFDGLRARLPGQSVRGVVVGDGPLRSSLEAQAAGLGLHDAMTFTGWQRDVSAIYRHLEVACLTSWNEGTPVALIEAMAAGRAVVATRVGGVQDLLGDEPDVPQAIAPGTYQVTKRGVLVRPGDVEGLIGAMTRLAQDAALRRQLGSTARAHVLERFSHVRLVREMSALYEALVREAT